MKYLYIILLMFSSNHTWSQMLDSGNMELLGCAHSNESIIEYYEKCRNSLELEARSTSLSFLITYCPLKADSIINIILGDTTWSDLYKITLIKNNITYFTGRELEPSIRQLMDSSSCFSGIKYYDYLTKLDSIRNVKYQLALEHDPDIFSELYIDLIDQRNITKRTYGKLDNVISLINLGDDTLEDSLISVINSFFKVLYVSSKNEENIRRYREFLIEQEIFKILAKIKTSNSVKRTLYLLSRYDNEENGSDYIIPSTASTYYATVLVNKSYKHFFLNIADIFDNEMMFPPAELNRFIELIKNKVNTDPTIWNSDIRNNINYDELK